MRRTLAAALLFVAIAGGATDVSAGSQAACLSGRQRSVLVTYEISGGPGGERFVLVVRRSGRATANPGAPLLRRVFAIGCRRLSALHRALEDARFPTLASRYGRDYPSNDSPTAS